MRSALPVDASRRAHAVVAPARAKRGVWGHPARAARRASTADRPSILHRSGHQEQNLRCEKRGKLTGLRNAGLRTKLLPVSVELARRLIESGAIAADEVERALFESVTSGVAFPQALASRGSDFLHMLEREVARSHVPLARSIRVLPEVAARLPRGLCERLLVVPIGRDAKSGAIDLACVDPFDPQVGSELSHHLQSPVRVFRVPLTELLLALELWLDERDAEHSAAGRTPAFGTRAVRKPSQPPAGRLSLRSPRALIQDASGAPIGADRPASSASPSEPPIPLVRRSIAPDTSTEANARWRKGTDPGVGLGGPQELLPETDEAGQPVIGLLRSKLYQAPPAGVQIGVLPDELVKAALAELAGATRPDEVIAALVHGLEALATRVLVLAIRAGKYEARAGSAGLGDPDRLRMLRLDANVSSVLETAVAEGYYLGLMPHTQIHDRLRELFGDGEVYVARIDVSERPALLFVMAGLETAFGATRRADELARAAGRALERIVRERKRP
jgi:hypothetical protein